MRVLIFSDLVRPNGAGVMALSAAEILSNAGHDVLLLAGAMRSDVVDSVRETTSANAAAFTQDERALDTSISPTARVAFQSAFDKWFRAELDGFGPDVLYVHNCGRVLDQLDLAELSQRVPVIHTMHDEWFISDAHYTFRPNATSRRDVRTFEPHRSPSLLQHSYDRLFEVPDRAGDLTLVAPSNWLADRARAVFPTLSVEHLPNAVDESLFTLQDRAEARRLLGLSTDRPVLMFVGNPTQARKGFAAFDAAAVSANELFDGAELIEIVLGGSDSFPVHDGESVLGPGPLKDRLAQPISAQGGRLKLSGEGLVISGLDRSLIPAIYGAADLQIHPSRIDNLPTVPIEAGMCGTRCLASNVGGTAETVADTNDLFDVDIDAESLGARIAAALHEVAVETTEQRSARRATQVGRFSTAIHTAGLLALLNRATRTAEVTA